MLEPSILSKHMDFFKRRVQANQVRIEKQLKIIDEKNTKLSQSKKRLVDLYASGELEKESYITKNLEYDNELNKIKIERTDLLGKIPLLHKKEIVEIGIKKYCDEVKVRFDKCIDFESKRQFLVDYIEKIIYNNEHVEIHGSVPIKLKSQDTKNTELAKIEFCVFGSVTMKERMRKN